MSWAFHDQRSPERLRILDALAHGKAEALVSPLWFYEMTNVLLVAERRRRLSVEQSEAFIALLMGLPIRSVPRSEADSLALLSIARTKGLTVYAAATLDLASQLGKLPLATLDLELAAAAKSIGVPGLAELSHLLTPTEEFRLK